jgi:glycosyltransferase involved in cell wall biosynthesis
LCAPESPIFQYLILGPGEHKAGVKAHVRRLGLDGVVRFEDGVALERLAQALGRASVGLVPNEATPATQLMLPVKLLEYVSLGIPVAASTLRTVRHYFPEDAMVTSSREVRTRSQRLSSSYTPIRRSVVV